MREKLDWIIVLLYVIAALEVCQIITKIIVDATSAK
jgi:hypothetical protein